jgi:hypothetical protein
MTTLCYLSAGITSVILKETQLLSALQKFADAVPSPLMFFN